VWGGGRRKKGGYSTVQERASREGTQLPRDGIAAFNLKVSVVKKVATIIVL
jgi:hypothetical protein